MGSRRPARTRRAPAAGHVRTHPLKGRLAKPDKADKVGIVLWFWRVTSQYATTEAARRIPPWKMSDEEATKWAARWGVEVERIEGSDERFAPQRAPGK